MKIITKIVSCFKEKFTRKNKPNPIVAAVESFIDAKIDALRAEISRNQRTKHLDSVLISEEAAKLVEMRINPKFDAYREEIKKISKATNTKTNRVLKDLEKAHEVLSDDFWSKINKELKRKIEGEIEIKSKFIYQRLDDFDSKINEIPTVEQLIDRKEEIDAILKSAKHTVSVADSTIKVLNIEEKKRHDALEYMAKRVSEFSGELKHIRDKIS